MGEVNVTATSWRMVEVGRVVLFTTGPYQGRLAVIAEIIDHKRVRQFAQSPSKALPYPSTNPNTSYTTTHNPSPISPPPLPSHFLLNTPTYPYTQPTNNPHPPPQVLVDGPSTTPTSLVPRHSAPLAHVTLTHMIVPKIPKGAGTGAIRKQWAAAEVDKSWEESAWALGRARSARRRELTDFERFKVMRLRKQVSFEFWCCLGFWRLWRQWWGLGKGMGWVVRIMMAANIVVLQARFEVRKSLAKVRATAKA